MLDPISFRVTEEATYLNHPSPYSVLMARLGPSLENHPQAIFGLRLINVVIAAIGLAALMAVGLVVRMPRTMLYAYIVPLACVPVLVPLAGAVNNDNAAFAGAGLATLGVWQLVATGKRAWLSTALVGLLVAAWAKFTALLLVGALAPYAVFVAQYASPVPATPAYFSLLEWLVLKTGKGQIVHLSAADFAVRFIVEFVTDWMPSFQPRHGLNYAALGFPVGAALCAVAGIAVSGRRVRRGSVAPLDVIVVAGALAFAATFLTHGVFSFARSATLGTFIDSFPRYYLPVIAVIPLAGLSLLSAIRAPRVRAALAACLLGGPIAFWLIGAPVSVLSVTAP